MDEHSSKPTEGKDDIPNGKTEQLENIKENIIKNIVTESDEPEVQWDGSEAEFVVDEDVEEFEDEYSGIKLCYTLNDDEIKDCVKILRDSLKTKKISSSKTKNVIETIILGLAFLCFAASFFMGYGIINLVMSVICLLVIVVVWYLPDIYLRKLISNKMFRGNYDVKIYPDEVEVKKDYDKKLSEKNKWIIPMDETSEFSEMENMLIILTKENKMLAIPLRSVEPSVIADVQGILFTGTKPFDD